MRVLSGKLKGLKILTNDKKFKGSESFITRPTSDRVKETLFNILEYGFNIDFSQISFFDCFSGSGAIGIEAISRGSSIVTFLDKDGVIHKDYPAEQAEKRGYKPLDDKASVKEKVSVKATKKQEEE